MIDDPSLGAGNVPFWLRDHGSDMQAPRIWLDRPWTGPDEIRRTVLSLDNIIKYLGIYRRMYRQLGVTPRSVVVIQFKLPIEVYLHWVALAAEGAIAAAVNPNLDLETALAYGRRTGAIGALIGSAPNTITDDTPTSLWWHPIVTESPKLPQEVNAYAESFTDDGGEANYRYKPEDVVLLYHTSGTTGLPKAVAASHHSFMAGIRSELRRPVSPLLDGAMFNALPAAHQSSFATITRALLSGTRIILSSDQSAQTLIEGVRRFEPGCIISFNCTLRDVARLGLEPGTFSSVGLWMTTGDASRRSDIAIVSALGTHPVASSGGIARSPGMYVLDCFGSSELGHVHFSCLHAPNKLGDARCIGRPSSFVTAAILDEEGVVLPDGEVGYLAVRSESITPGYWNDQERTAASWRDGYWITGDVGYRDEYGRYFHLDRHTDVIKTSEGFIYSVRSEEELLVAIPEIERCAVVARPADDGKIEAVCLIESRDPHIGEGAWHLKINSVLVGASLPPVAQAIVVPFDSLPLGPTGKIRKFIARTQLNAINHH